MGQEINDLFKLARRRRLQGRAVHAVVREGTGRGGLADDETLNVVERAGENLLLAEDYIAREAPGEMAATRRTSARGRRVAVRCERVTTR